MTTPPEDPTPEMLDRGASILSRAVGLDEPSEAIAHDVWQGMYDEWQATPASPQPDAEARGRPSCHCPADPGEPCPLTVMECDRRSQASVASRKRSAPSPSPEAAEPRTVEFDGNTMRPEEPYFLDRAYGDLQARFDALAKHLTDANIQLHAALAEIERLRKE